MATSTYFAQNATQLQAALDVARAHITAHPEHHWMLLIDSAFDHPVPPALYSGVNGYANTAADDLAEVAPWLIPVYSPGGTLPETKELIEKWLRHCSGRPMLGLIACEGDARALADYWADLHFMETSDPLDKPLLLRVADTRVTPTLGQWLTPAQWATWTRYLSHWLTIDRQGALQALVLADKETSAARPPAIAPLLISNQQINTLTDAAEPDALIGYMAEHLADMVPPEKELPPAKFYDYVHATLQLAREHGVTQFPDKMALVTATVLSGGKSLTDPRTRALLLLRQWSPGQLDTALLDAKII